MTHLSLHLAEACPRSWAAALEEELVSPPGPSHSPPLPFVLTVWHFLFVFSPSFNGSASGKTMTPSLKEGKRSQRASDSRCGGATPDTGPVRHLDAEGQEWFQLDLVIEGFSELVLIPVPPPEERIISEFAPPVAISPTTPALCFQCPGAC